jgi:hypothetical protein
MLGTFFCFIDYMERAAPELMAVPCHSRLDQPSPCLFVKVPLLGGFIKGGVGATLGWLIAWPFETVKNQALYCFIRARHHCSLHHNPTMLCSQCHLSGSPPCATFSGSQQLFLQVQGADGKRLQGRTTLEIMGAIVKSDGVRGLWRGVGPGAMRRLPRT